MLVHGVDLVHWDDGFGCGRFPAKGTAWSDGIVVMPPFLDDDPLLVEGIEDFTVE